MGKEVWAVMREENGDVSVEAICTSEEAANERAVQMAIDFYGDEINITYAELLETITQNGFIFLDEYVPEEITSSFFELQYYVERTTYFS